MPRWRSWMLTGMVLLGVTVHPARAQLCLPDLDSSTPFATPMGTELLATPAAISPADVFLHAQRLRRNLDALGFNVEASSAALLPLSDVLPRHNYVLAFDLMILLQLWWQEKEQIAHMPPSLSYPRDVIPADVYRWVDASFALSHCFHDLATEDPRNETLVRDASMAPSDVYILLSAMVQAVSQQVSLASIRAMQMHRLNQILYFTQDALLETSDHSLVNWQQPDTLHGSHAFEEEVPTAMAAQILEELDGFNRRATSKLAEAALTGDEKMRTRALTFLLTQIFGELQTWASARGVAVNTPPLAPVIHSLHDERMIVDRLQAIHALLHEASLVEAAVVHHEEHTHD